MQTFLFLSCLPVFLPVNILVWFSIYFSVCIIFKYFGPLDSLSLFVYHFKIDNIALDIDWFIHKNSFLKLFVKYNFKFAHSGRSCSYAVISAFLSNKSFHSCQSEAMQCSQMQIEWYLYLARKKNWKIIIIWGI